MRFIEFYKLNEAEMGGGTPPPPTGGGLGGKPPGGATPPMGGMGAPPPGLGMGSPLGGGMGGGLGAPPMGAMGGAPNGTPAPTNIEIEVETDPFSLLEKYAKKMSVNKKSDDTNIKTHDDVPKISLNT